MVCHLDMDTKNQVAKIYLREVYVGGQLRSLLWNDSQLVKAMDYSI